MPETRKFTEGQEVETIHGEKITVIKVESVIVKIKGQPTGEVGIRILAQSGDQKNKNGEPMLTWFPTELIK